MKSGIRRLLCLTVALIVGLTACSPATGNTSPTNIQNIDPTIGIPSGGTSVAALSEEGDLGIAVEVASGEVTITQLSGQYKVGDIIVVTIANGLDQTIYAADMKSACAIAILEMWNGSDWESFGCGMERLPMVLAIGSGMGRTVIFDPRNQVFGTGSADIFAFGAGKYRIRFTYRFDRTAEGDEPYSVQSPEFQIMP